MCCSSNNRTSSDHLYNMRQEGVCWHMYVQNTHTHTSCFLLIHGFQEFPVMRTDVRLVLENHVTSCLGSVLFVRLIQPWWVKLKELLSPDLHHDVRSSFSGRWLEAELEGPVDGGGGGLGLCVSSQLMGEVRGADCSPCFSPLYSVNDS